MTNSNESKQKYLLSARQSIPMVIREMNLIGRSLKLESDPDARERLFKRYNILVEHLMTHEAMGLDTRPLLKNPIGLKQFKALLKIEMQIREALKECEV